MRDLDDAARQRDLASEHLALGHRRRPVVGEHALHDADLDARHLRPVALVRHEPGRGSRGPAGGGGRRRRALRRRRRGRRGGGGGGGGPAGRRRVAARVAGDAQVDAEVVVRLRAGLGPRVLLARRRVPARVVAHWSASAAAEQRRFRRRTRGGGGGARRRAQVERRVVGRSRLQRRRRQHRRGRVAAAAEVQRKTGRSGGGGGCGLHLDLAVLQQLSLIHTISVIAFSAISFSALTLLVGRQ